MRGHRTLVIAGLIAAALTAHAGLAGAATSVAGKYGCKPYKARNALIQSAYGLTLKSGGHYGLTYYGANGGTATGSFTKSDNKLTFSSGPLKGKSGTFHGPGGSGLTAYKAEIVFASWIGLTPGKQSCRR